MMSIQQSCVRLLIVDDHELTRLFLKSLFSNRENVEVVGLASNGQEGIKLAELYVPDVIILDLQMPVVDGLSAASWIKGVAPQTKIIVYTSLEDPQTEVMIQTAPVDEFCRKDVSTETLIEMVEGLGMRSLESGA